MEWLNIAVTRSSVFRRVLKKLEEEMKKSSLDLRFEMAAYFKDMIDILKEKYRKLNDKDIEDFIIFVYLASLNILCYPVYNTKE